MIKEITLGEETLEIDLDGAPLWKIWILHIVLLVRFGKLLKESSQTNTTQQKPTQPNNENKPTK